MRLPLCATARPARRLTQLAAGHPQHVGGGDAVVQRRRLARVGQQQQPAVPPGGVHLRQGRGQVAGKQLLLGGGRGGGGGGSRVVVAWAQSAAGWEPLLQLQTLATDQPGSLQERRDPRRSPSKAAGQLQGTAGHHALARRLQGTAGQQPLVDARTAAEPLAPHLVMQLQELVAAVPRQVQQHVGGGPRQQALGGRRARRVAPCTAT